MHLKIVWKLNKEIKIFFHKKLTFSSYTLVRVILLKININRLFRLLLLYLKLLVIYYLWKASTIIFTHQELLIQMSTTLTLMKFSTCISCQLTNSRRKISLAQCFRLLPTPSPKLTTHWRTREKVSNQIKTRYNCHLPCKKSKGNRKYLWKTEIKL